jgi:Heterokaryon incompatibility protein (HET)
LKLQSNFQSSAVGPTRNSTLEMGSSFLQSAQENWRFKPLQGSEIRLVRIRREENGYTGCELQHFELTESLEFTALSYVWGDEPAPQPIWINNKTYKVTKNLYDALQVLPDVVSEKHNGWVWIDAICINQENTIEQSKQVPRMSQIYSLARSTMYWLGPNAPANFNLVLLVANNMTALQELKLSQLRDAHKPGFILFMQAVLECIQNEWFTRVWTTQEYALSGKNRFAVIGTHTFLLESIFVILMKMRDVNNFGKSLGGQDAIIYRLCDRGFRQLRGMLDMIKEIASDEWGSEDFSAQILSLLRSSVGRKSRKPQDRIYGLLGMITANIPSGLEPDYSIPTSQLFHDYTKYIIQGTGDLRILFCYGSSLSDVPTWVPDLQRSSMPVGISALITRGETTFSENGQRLTVQGVKIDKISKYTSRGERSRSEYIQHNLKLIVRILSNIQNTTGMKALINWMNDEYMYNDFSDQGSEDFQSVQDVMSVVPEKWRKGPVALDSLDGMNGIWLAKLSSADYLVLESDEVGICITHHQSLVTDPNLELWALKGSPIAFVLSRYGDNYKMVGHCLTLLDSNRVHYNEKFFSERTVNQIDLI